MTSLNDYVKWVTQRVDEVLMMRPLLKHVGSGYEIVVLHRTGRFQVEHARVVPCSLITHHRHPNVDSVEYYLSGDFVLNVSGHLFHAHPGLKSHRRIVPVKATDWHSATVGATGAEFFSIQHWATDLMSSVVVDWDGPREVILHANA